MVCNLQETWAGMEGVVDQGLTRSIGVSNFSPDKIEDWFQDARIPPAVNQVDVKNNSGPESGPLSFSIQHA